jgi:ribokinase
VDEFFDLPHIVRPGETISSTGMTKRAGGKGANQAYALAKAGGRVSLDGNVGSDGQWVRDMLSENGVDVSRVGVLDNEVRSIWISQFGVVGSLGTDCWNR